MKVLLDTFISAQAAESVRQSGHDVIWSADWPRDPGDEEILRRATTESRILATIDKDFGEVVIVQDVVHVEDCDHRLQPRNLRVAKRISHQRLE